MRTSIPWAGAALRTCCGANAQSNTFLTGLPMYSCNSGVRGIRALHSPRAAISLSDGFILDLTKMISFGVMMTCSSTRRPARHMRCIAGSPEGAVYGPKAAPRILRWYAGNGYSVFTKYSGASHRHFLASIITLLPVCPRDNQSTHAFRTCVLIIAENGRFVK